jgi:hypothetical protein
VLLRSEAKRIHNAGPLSDLCWQKTPFARHKTTCNTPAWGTPYHRDFHHGHPKHFTQSYPFEIPHHILTHSPSVGLNLASRLYDSLVNIGIFMEAHYDMI